MKHAYQSLKFQTHSSVVKLSVFGWQTYPDLCLIYGWQVNCPLWVSQLDQLSFPSLGSVYLHGLLGWDH